MRQTGAQKLAAPHATAGVVDSLEFNAGIHLQGGNRYSIGRFFLHDVDQSAFCIYQLRLKQVGFVQRLLSFIGHKDFAA